MLNEVLNYYNRYFFESKREDIKLIEDYIQDGKGELKPEYLNDINIAKKMNDRFQIINFMFIKLHNENKRNETEFNKVVYDWNLIEKMINDKKVKKMQINNKKILAEYFLDENNKESLLKIFNEDSYEFFKMISQNLVNEKKERNKENIDENIDENKLNELKEILNYYKNYLFESKIEDIKIIEEIIKNRNGNYKEYIQKDLENARKMNDRLNIINFFFNSKYINKNEEEFNEVVKWWEMYECMIKDKKIKKIAKIDKKILFEFFSDENNKDLLLKIFNQESYEYFLKENMNNKINKKKDNRINLKINKIFHDK